jgi:hypothetical protein
VRVSTVAFVVRHPVRAYRFTRACRQPWPELTGIDAVTIAEAVVEAEARKVSRERHPSMWGRS